MVRLVIASIAALLFLSVPWSRAADESLCDLCGQSASTNKGLVGETNFTGAVPNARLSSRRIARVLLNKPLALELLGESTSHTKNHNLLPESLRSKMSVATLPLVNASLRGNLGNLSYGDIVNVEYGTYSSSSFDGMPTFGKEVVAVSKTADTAPSKLLISFRKSAQTMESLNIYAEGMVTYVNNDNTAFAGQLSRAELGAVLSSFAQAKFDSLPSDLAGPTLMLSCRRYQPVTWPSYKKQLAPIFAKFEAIENKLVQAGYHRLAYDKKYHITDWNYGNIVPIGDVSGPLMDHIKSTYGAIPKELVDQIRSGACFRFRDHLYFVSFGDYGPQRLDADQGKARTARWGDIRWKQIDEYDWCIRSLPLNLGFKLSDLPEAGRPISPADYAKGRQFYDERKKESQGYDTSMVYWREGNSLYHGLSVVRDPGANLR